MRRRAASVVLLFVAVCGCALATGCTVDPPQPTPTAAPTVSEQPLRPRAVHTATPLGDGRVLIAGGCAVDGCSTAEVEPSSEFYLPERGFVAGPPMVQARNGHTATVLGDGRVLIVGGWASEGTRSLRDAELFDPATDTFTPAGSLHTGRGGHTATALPDGRVLVVGGWSDSGAMTAEVELYDPATDSFTPGPPMPQPRDAAVAAALPDGSVIVIGGRTSRSDESLASTVIYDPVADAWRDGPTMSTPRFKLAAIALSDGRILVLGGTTDDVELLASTELLDPESLRFTAGPAMSTMRYKFIEAVARTASGLVVVAGGSGIDALTIDGLQFDAIADSGGVRSSATATALPDGSVLVIGGYDERLRMQPDALVVDPS